MLFLFLLFNKKGSLHHRLPDVTRFLVIVQFSKTESSTSVRLAVPCHFCVTGVSPEVEALYTRRLFWRQEIKSTFFLLSTQKKFTKTPAQWASGQVRISHSISRPNY